MISHCLKLSAFLHPRSGSFMAMNTSTTTNHMESVACPRLHSKEFVILGSGVSTAIPRISCIIRSKNGHYCRPCHDAVKNPSGPNCRGNVSALVRLAGHTVLIDCGKTIREVAIRHFPSLGVKEIDAIVLTHGHADAFLGLDDARDIQLSGVAKQVDGKTRWIPPKPIPIYLNEETMGVCRNAFPYLIPDHQQAPNCKKEKDIPRRVASLSWNVYNEDKYFAPFHPIPDVGIEFTPFPMYHGGTYICMGFLIRIQESPKSKQFVVAYLSDANDLPDRTWAFLKDQPRIDLLVVDLLTKSQRNKSHFHWNQTIDVVRKIRPERAVAVGMTCSLGMHDEVNEELAAFDKEGLNLRLAYDGMRFPA